MLTELSQLPAPDYGTVCRHISEMQTYHAFGSVGHYSLKTFCFDSGATAHCELFLYNCAVEKLILVIYLLRPIYVVLVLLVKFNQSNF